MNAIHRLTELFARLPGLGPKSAQRIVYHFLHSDASYAEQVAEELVTLKRRVVRCSECNYYTEQTMCHICSDSKRDQHTLCVVSSPNNVDQLENSLEYNGVYHVLQGSLSPLDGRGPNEIGAPALLQRVRRSAFRELIIATNPTVEGETTALYIVKLLQEESIAITRLAMGLPMGGDIGYVDKYTIARSLKDRKPM